MNALGLVVPSSIERIGIALTGVSWNSTPPSTPIIEKYNISQVGKRVTIDYLLAYTSAGTTNTRG